MAEFTTEELSEAHRALLSTLRKCEKIDIAKLGKSQQTLLERRISALKIALTLIELEVAAHKAGKTGRAIAVAEEIATVEQNNDSKE